ncbi:MAG: hypothetical protein ACPG5R_02010 [Cognaticolwellia aestuarii]
MKNSENKVMDIGSKLTCYGCGLQDNTVDEYTSGVPQPASDFMKGIGRITSVNLCEQCFADMCDGSSRVRDSRNEDQGGSVLQIAARDILSANKITNQSELSIALKRVEELWGAQYYSAEGNELHRLADLICGYEGKSWNSYIDEEGCVSDDFLTERENGSEK